MMGRHSFIVLFITAVLRANVKGKYAVRKIMKIIITGIPWNTWGERAEADAVEFWAYYWPYISLCAFYQSLTSHFIWYTRSIAW